MLNYNVNKVLDEFKKLGGKTNFPDSLKTVLTWAKNDKNIKNLKHLAYLLATAKIESDYSLQRWESDYLCGSTGVPYIGKPCQRALDYFASSAGNKINYYNLGVDSTGLPYFGRGLIQLTGKANYKTYGDIIGVDLVKNADLALVPKNSYRIAIEYFKRRKTFDWVDKNNLIQARKSVNGGLNHVNDVNRSYVFWLNVLENSTNKVVNKKNTTLLGISIISATLGIGLISLWYLNYGRK